MHMTQAPCVQPGHYETLDSMSFGTELAALFQRDLTRLLQQLETFRGTSTLWQVIPGIENSAGNLTLHLEGNLREYIGRQLGGISYQRQRDLEFSNKGISAEELIARIEDVLVKIPPTLASLTDAQLEAIYPENVLKKELTTRQYLIHTNGHLNYHLGQIDYLRRVLTAGSAVPYATL
jgi:hypothetical protein